MERKHRHTDSIQKSADLFRRQERHHRCTTGEEWERLVDKAGLAQPSNYDVYEFARTRWRSSVWNVGQTQRAVLLPGSRNRKRVVDDRRARRLQRIDPQCKRY